MARPESATAGTLIVLDRDGVLNRLLDNPAEPRPDSPMRAERGGGLPLGAGGAARSDGRRLRAGDRQQPAGRGQGEDHARRARGGARRGPAGGHGERRRHPELAPLLPPRRGRLRLPQAGHRACSKRPSRATRPSPARAPGWSAIGRPTSSPGARSASRPRTSVTSPPTTTRRWPRAAFDLPFTGVICETSRNFSWDDRATDGLVARAILFVGRAGCRSRFCWWRSRSVYLFIITAGTFTTWSTWNTNYDLIAEGFRSGHLYIPVPPPPELLARPNPFDWSNSNLWFLDASLYKGHYYLYWGPLPALVLLAVKTVLRIKDVIGDQYVVFASYTLILIAGALFITRMTRRLFPELPPAWPLLATVALRLRHADPVHAGHPGHLPGGDRRGAVAPAAGLALRRSTPSGRPRRRRRRGPAAGCRAAAGRRPSPAA